MSTALSAAFDRAGYADPMSRLRTLMNQSLDTAPEIFTPGPERAPDTARLKEIAMESVIKSPKNWDGAKDTFFKAVRNDAELMWALFEPYRAAAAQRILSEVSAERHRAEVAARGPDTRQVFTRPEAIRAAPREVAKAAAVVATLTVLDTFKVNGKPIGDLTSGEAVKWAGARERDARFVRLLTQNLPPDQPIRQFRTGKDAAAIYEQAQDSGHE